MEGAPGEGTQSPVILLDSKSSWSWRGVVGLAVLALMLGYCGITAYRAGPIAERAAGTLHERIQMGDADAVYNGATPGYQKDITFVNNRRLVETLKSRLGTCQYGKPETTVNVGTDGTVVTLHYVAACTGGSLNESTTWLIESGEGRLVRLQVDSNAFLQ